MAWVRGAGAGPGQQPPFLRNKIAQVLVCIVQVIPSLVVWYEVPGLANTAHHPHRARRSEHLPLLLRENSVHGHVSSEKPRQGRPAMLPSAHATTHPVVKNWRMCAPTKHAAPQIATCPLTGVCCMAAVTGLCSHHVPSMGISDMLGWAMQIEFPEQWPSFFTELVAMLGGGDGPVDMFCRVLVAIDEDVVSLDIPRSPEGVRASMALKARWLSCKTSATSSRREAHERAASSMAEHAHVLLIATHSLEQGCQRETGRAV